MKELKKESGLNIVLKDDFKLELDISLLGGEFSSRTVSDMRPVIKDEIEPSDEPLYFMYRDVRTREDDTKIHDAGLRFDLTVLLPKMLGKEFNKTFGHYHPLKIGTAVSYPEVYEVISGTALCLLQKQTKIDNRVIEVFLVEVRVGQKMIVPPNFGHVTINPMEVPLVLSNWVGNDFNSEYEIYEKNHGAAYYISKSDIPVCSRQATVLAGRRNPKSETNLNLKIEKNKHYTKLLKLINVKPKELPQFALEFDKPMYQSGSSFIEKIKFLTTPEDFIDQLQPELLFQGEGI